MQITHGVSVGKQETAISTPVTANSGVHFVVGTAPVHTVGGKTNEVIIAYNYQEAVTALGYSDDWRKYSLCEEIYAAFKLYNISPIILVNVLDPTKHKKTGGAKRARSGRGASENATRRNKGNSCGDRTRRGDRL